MARTIAAGLLLAMCTASSGASQVASSGDPSAQAEVGAARAGDLTRWIDHAAAGLASLDGVSDADLLRTGPSLVLRLYLDDYEPIEGWYGPGAPHGVEPLSSVVARGEARFHELLRATDASSMRRLAADVRGDLDAIRESARSAGVPLTPDPALAIAAGGDALQSTTLPADLSTQEMRSLAEEFAAAHLQYAQGDAEGARARVERAYLQEFEPIEARLPSRVTREVETLIHIRLRPQMAAGASLDDVAPTFAAIQAGLARADAALAGGSSFWFGAVTSFAIIVREGLEAVLLIAAMLAYLSGIGAPGSARRKIWIGTAAGVGASVLTWVAASTFIPVSGAGREVMEGVTALVAVIVLLYVSNWLFQKTYIHDWKNYLRTQVGRALTTGSAIAMAGLAFAAVYREGFETVLFYQALLFDSSSAAVLSGFLPGTILIVAVGAAILRMGAKLPLRTLFGATNAILLFLAFAFVGKGIYNLQEAGVFAPHAVTWMPDHELLRQVLGMYPLVETLAAQATLVMLVTATYVFYRRRIAARAVGAHSTSPGAIAS